MALLNIGDVAPAFSAQDQHGKTITLASLKGKHVVLYFYPKDDTPGCTKEACAFRDHNTDLLKSGAVVLGVSADSVASHAKFAEKFTLNFSLLADEDKAIVTAYGAWGEKTNYGKTYMGIHRISYVIAPDGKIKAVFPKVKPEEHAAEILAAVK